MTRLRALIFIVFLSWMMSLHAVSDDVNETSSCGETFISDIAGGASANVWTPVSYETTDGVRGRMLYAPWGLEPHSRVEIPLPARGRFLIVLGMLGRQYPLGRGPDRVLLRLKSDPAPVIMCAGVETSDAGWWSQVRENVWKIADLEGDSLIVENMRNCRGTLVWIRLIPTEESPGRWAHPHRPMSVSNDAYRPVESMDEVLAPFMRLKDSPVKSVHFCVGNGAYSLAVPSRIALPTVFDGSVQYETESALRIARSYSELHKKHPRLLDEMIDFAHSIGLEFHVSFRTGCTMDILQCPASSNAAEPGPAAKGICRSQNYCRLFDGTPVARFSYANEAVQEYFLRFYAEMLDSKADGISLVWIRALPAMLFEQSFCDRFKAEFGEDVCREDDPRVVVLRKSILTDYHRRVRKLAGRRKVTLFVPAVGSICETFGLDVRRLAEEGLVDAFVIGDTLQDARHTQSFDFIDFAYFKDACRGTRATYDAFLWGGNLRHVARAFREGAGVLYWDGAVKDWWGWEMVREATDEDGSKGLEWLKANPVETRIKVLKMLHGFDAKTYPWHIAY